MGNEMETTICSVQMENEMEDEIETDMIWRCAWFRREVHVGML